MTHVEVTLVNNKDKIEHKEKEQDKNSDTHQYDSWQDDEEFVKYKQESADKAAKKLKWKKDSWFTKAIKSVINKIKSTLTKEI